MKQLLALSVRQPWAELIITSRKIIEVRKWNTNNRGLIVIHTGYSVNKKLENYFGYKNLFHGGYIGIVSLDLVIPFDEHKWYLWKNKHLDNGKFQEGFFAWILSNPFKFKNPIKEDGQLGFFSPSENSLKAINEEIRNVYI